MASLRFNYNGEKRSERNRPPGRGMMPRRTPFFYPHPFSVPPQSKPSLQPREEAAVPEPPGPNPHSPELPLPTEQGKAEALLPAKETVGPGTLPQEPEKEMPAQEQDKREKALAQDGLEQPEPVAQIPEGPGQGVSERLIASLESYESGMVKLRQHVDTSKVVLDQLLFQLDSVLKILDILKENEERKLKQPQVSVVMQKSHKDTIDEILELLQTPAVQNILRQALVGILVKR